MKYAATFDATEWRLIRYALDVLSPDSPEQCTALAELRARCDRIEHCQAPAPRAPNVPQEYVIFWNKNGTKDRETARLFTARDWYGGADIPLNYFMHGAAQATVEALNESPTRQGYFWIEARPC
jgi:hypothetical protein